MALGTTVTLLLMKKKLLLLRKLRLKIRKMQNKRLQRRWWVHPIWINRKKEGYFHTLVSLIISTILAQFSYSDNAKIIIFQLKKMRLHDHAYFRNFTRMSPELFDELVALLSNQIQKYPLSREPLSPAHRLAITLR